MHNITTVESFFLHFCRFEWRAKLHFDFKPLYVSFDRPCPMVLILDGNSEICAHERSNTLFCVSV